VPLPTLKTLHDSIELIIEDGGYSDRIPEFVNDIIHELAEEIPFPALQRDDVIITTPDVDYKALPDDYHRGLYRVYDVTNQRMGIAIRDNKIHLDAVPPEAGDVFAVAISQGRLYFRFVPAVATSLRLYYYAFPTELVQDTDVIDFCDVKTASMAKGAIVHGVCMKIYDQIEDGIAGKKVNTQVHELRYQNYKFKLKTHCRHDFLRPPVIPIVL
jgi:hypothetical protein